MIDTRKQAKMDTQVRVVIDTPERAKIDTQDRVMIGTQRAKMDTQKRVLIDTPERAKIDTQERVVIGTQRAKIDMYPEKGADRYPEGKDGNGAFSDEDMYNWTAEPDNHGGLMKITMLLGIMYQKK